MKNYRNGMKATEFNKFNLKKLYRLSKEGTYKVEKTMMNKLYDLADFYGYDDNRNVERDESKILDFLKEVESDNVEKAQELITEFTNDYFERMNKRVKASWNHEFVK